MEINLLFLPIEIIQYILSLEIYDFYILTYRSRESIAHTREIMKKRIRQMCLVGGNFDKQYHQKEWIMATHVRKLGSIHSRIRAILKNSCVWYKVQWSFKPSFFMMMCED